MKYSNQTIRCVLLVCLLINTVIGMTAAATTQVIAKIQSSHFLEGTNLTDNSPSAAINIDWSSNSGFFVGLDCFASSIKKSDGIDIGCDTYGGYFKKLNVNNALSAKITRHQYSEGFGQEWDFTEFSSSWHIGNTTQISAIYSQNWLNRPFDTVSLKGQSKLAISEKLNLDLSGNIMKIESGAPVNTLMYARATLSYTHNRWTADIGIAHTGRDQLRMVPFDADTAQLFFAINYRLY